MSIVELSKAFYRKDLESIKEIMARPDFDINERDKDGDNIVAIVISTNYNASPQLREDGFDLKVLDLALSHKDVDPNLVTSGWSALQLCANHIELEYARRLLKHPLTLPDFSPVSEMTPLLTAINKGSLEMVSLLLQNRADVNRVTKNGETPLRFALKSKKRDTIRHLLEHPSINVNEVNGDAFLCQAIRYCDAEIVSMIVGHRKFSLEKLGSFKPLNYACQGKDPEVTRILLGLEGIDINGVDPLGKSPIRYAFYNSDTSEHFKMLLADPRLKIEPFDPYNFSHKEKFEMLIKRDEFNLEWTRNGKNILFDECINWSVECMKPLLRSIHLSGKFDMNIRDRGNYNILMHTLKHRRWRVAEFLLAIPDISITQIGADGQTCLSLSKNSEKEQSDLVDECFHNPAKRMELCKKEGLHIRYPSQLFKIIVLEKGRPTDIKIKNFLRVARRLPPELQMRLCNLAYGINEEFIQMY